MTVKREPGRAKQGGSVAARNVGQRLAQDTTPAAGRQARIAAIVICVTVVLWMGASWIGGMIGLPVRFAFLFDFAALAAFAWALIVLFRVWRSGQKTEE